MCAQDFEQVLVQEFVQDLPFQCLLGITTP